MSKTDQQMEDADIKAAINAVAAYKAGRVKRDLVQRITEDIEPEITQARMNGQAIDVTGLFLRLAETYAD